MSTIKHEYASHSKKGKGKVTSMGCSNEVPFMGLPSHNLDPLLQSVDGLMTLQAAQQEAAELKADVAMVENFTSATTYSSTTHDGVWQSGRGSGSRLMT